MSTVVKIKKNDIKTWRKKKISTNIDNKAGITINKNISYHIDNKAGINNDKNPS